MQTSVSASEEEEETRRHKKNILVLSIESWLQPRSMHDLSPQTWTQGDPASIFDGCEVALLAKGGDGCWMR